MYSIIVFNFRMSSKAFLVVNSNLYKQMYWFITRCWSRPRSTTFRCWACAETRYYRSSWPSRWGLAVGGRTFRRYGDDDDISH